MKYIDYREELGIGFSDENIFKMLLNRIDMGFELLKNGNDRLFNENMKFIAYFIEVGEQPSYPFDYNLSGVRYNIGESKSINEVISKCVVLINLSNEIWYSAEWKEYFSGYFYAALNDLNIQYETKEDNDGCFVFPKGAKELDDALVSEPLEWLKDYPNARKTYVVALKQYSEGVYIRDVADNLRKALETFFQEFLGNTKNLETNKNEICKYLGAQGVDAGITGLFQPLINSYKNINDRIAKHNDAVDEKLLEFLLYQTGVLIRMVIVVEKGGNK